MKLPNSAHCSRPWRIHDLSRDFRLEDVSPRRVGERAQNRSVSNHLPFISAYG